MGNGAEGERSPTETDNGQENTAPARHTWGNGSQEKGYPTASRPLDQAEPAADGKSEKKTERIPQSVIGGNAHEHGKEGDRHGEDRTPNWGNTHRSLART